MRESLENQFMKNSFTQTYQSLPILDQPLLSPGVSRDSIKQNRSFPISHHMDSFKIHHTRSSQMFLRVTTHRPNASSRVISEFRSPLVADHVKISYIFLSRLTPRLSHDLEPEVIVSRADIYSVFLSEVTKSGGGKEQKEKEGMKKIQTTSPR